MTCAAIVQSVCCCWLQDRVRGLAFFTSVISRLVKAPRTCVSYQSSGITWIKDRPMLCLRQLWGITAVFCRGCCTDTHTPFSRERFAHRSFPHVQHGLVRWNSCFIVHRAFRCLMIYNFPTASANTFAHCSRNNDSLFRVREKQNCIWISSCRR